MSKYGKMISDEIHITDHAYCRMKERLGLNKKAARRISSKAYLNGLRRPETKGVLYDYFVKNEEYSEKASTVRIYGEVVYCFCNDTAVPGNREPSLVTVYQLPNRLKTSAIQAQRKYKLLGK